MKYLFFILFIISCDNKKQVNFDINRKNISNFYYSRPSIYGENLKIIICSPEEAKKSVDSTYDFTNVQGLTSSNEGNITIWISDSADETTMVHESFHATYHILSWAGVKLVPESEEAFAYLQESIYSDIVTVSYLSKK